MKITPETIAKSCHWSGDDVALLFIQTLTECNFHIEAEIIGVVWDALNFYENANLETKIDQIKSQLSDLSRGKQ